MSRTAMRARTWRLHVPPDIPPEGEDPPPDRAPPPPTAPPAEKERGPRPEIREPGPAPVPERL